MTRTWKWLFLVAATVVAVPVAAGVGAVLGDMLGLWAEPFFGFAAAAAFVLVPYKLAPSRGVLVAASALFVGALVAWWLIRPPSHYPDGYGERSYAPTYLPIICTYTAGLAAWIFCVWHQRRRA